MAKGGQCEGPVAMGVLESDGTCVNILLWHYHVIFQDVPTGEIQVNITWGFSVLFFINDVILIGFKVKCLIKRLMNIIKNMEKKYY